LRIPVTICFLLLINFPLSATNFYLSEKGNNNNIGTTRTKPWQTIDALYKVLPTLQPGDSILFERGSIFRGHLEITLSGTEENPIYIGAYGTGKNPVIKGGISVFHWKTLKKNIWTTDCKACEYEPLQLFINKKLQCPGRYPDSGYKTFIIADGSKNSITDSTLSFKDNYWERAEIVVRSSRWTLDRLFVLDFRKNIFTYLTAPSYPLESGHGYFIQKHINTLTKNGEWYYDSASKKIHLYLDESIKPESQKIEISQRSIGLLVTKSKFIKIEDLELHQFQESGVRLSNSDFISINRLVVKHSGKNGMEVSGCTTPVISQCLIESSANNGVEWSNNKEGKLIQNEIIKTGIFAGLGTSGNGTYIGLSITGDPLATNNSFLYNRIDSTGYIAIDFRTGGNLIKNNFIQNFCLIKDDGAGIYTWGTNQQNNIIEGNIIQNGSGNGEGTPHPYYRYASGIYIDDNSSNITVKNNTVAYCAQAGIFIHNSGNVKILNNTLFANGYHLSNKEKGQLYIRQDEIVKVKNPLNLEVSQNNFIAVDENSYCIYWRAESNADTNRPGAFHENRYVTSSHKKIIALHYKQSALCDAPVTPGLEEWQRKTGEDNDSHFDSTASVYQPTVAAPAPINTDGWITWPGESKLVGCANDDETCIQIISSPSQRESLLYHAGFAFKKNSVYRLTFSARSNASSTIEFVPLMADTPWAALSDYTCFSLDTAFTAFTYLFQSNQDYPNARLNFKNNEPWEIKNVTFCEVALNKELFKLLINPSSKSRLIEIPKGYHYLDGNMISTSLSLQPFSSIIIKQSASTQLKAKK
jgi:parallel beta-helix repeat protein